MSHQDHDPLDSIIQNAAQTFRALSRDEKAIVRSFKSGVIDFTPDDHPIEPPGSYDDISPRFSIPPDFVRWLLNNAFSNTGILLEEVKLCGVALRKDLDLSNTKIPCPVSFKYSKFDQCILLNDSETRSITFETCAIKSIFADRLKVKGSFYLIPSHEIRNGHREQSHVVPTYVDSDIRLCGAEIDGNFDCKSACIGKGLVSDKGPEFPVFADGIVVHGNVLFVNGFEVHGGVKLRGSSIGRNLDLSGATLNARRQDSLSIDNSIVGGDVLLRRCEEDEELYRGWKDVCFRSVGHISMRGAEIKGNLICHGAKICHPESNRSGATNATALTADAARIQGSIEFQKNFEARGQVTMINAHVGSDLNCRGASFENAGDLAITADGIEVDGTTFMDDEFKTNGIVSLVHATLKEGLYMRGAKFFVGGYKPTGFSPTLPEDRWFNSGDRGLDARYLDIRGKFDWRDVDGRSGDSSNGYFRVDLFHAHTILLRDSPDSWPHAYKNGATLDLVGFKYDGLYGFKKDQPYHIKLIEDHYKKEPFDPRPYIQLGKVLRQSGYAQIARNLGIQRERNATKYGDYGKWRKIGRLILQYSIDYGYKPLKVIRFLLVWWFVSVIIFHNAYTNDQMIPLRRGVPENPTSSLQQTDRIYIQFNPLIFALDTLIPIANLRQVEYYAPKRYSSIDYSECERKPHRVQIPWFRCFVKVSKPGSLSGWLYLLNPFIGWILTTLFIAGFTRIVKED